MNDSHKENVRKIFIGIVVVLAIVSVLIGNPLIVLYFNYALIKGMDKMFAGSSEMMDSKWNLMSGTMKYLWPVFALAILSNFLPESFQELLFISLWDITGLML